MRPVNTDENGLVVNHDDLLEAIAICNIAYFQQYPATLGFAGKLSRKEQHGILLDMSRFAVEYFSPLHTALAKTQKARPEGRAS